MPADAGALTLAFPGSWDQPTGGYRYDRALAAALAAQGWAVTPLSLPAALPQAGPADASAAEAALAARPAGEPLLIDGLALAGLADAAARLAQRAPLVALIHHPVALETGLAPSAAETLARQERAALAACACVIATSAYTARRLTQDYDVPADKLAVAPPGLTVTADTGPRRASAFSGTPVRLLCLGALAPRKGQDLLVDALACLATETPWHLDLVGPGDRDPTFAAQLDRRIAQAGLTERVTRHGAVADEALPAVYGQADIAVLPSRFEGYGMAAQEALAAGVPVLAAAAGALAETADLPGCRQVPPADIAALRAELGELIDNGAYRQRLAADARGLRGRWPTWSSAAAIVARALATAARALSSPR